MTEINVHDATLESAAIGRGSGRIVLKSGEVLVQLNFKAGDFHYLATELQSLSERASNEAEARLVQPRVEDDGTITYDGARYVRLSQDEGVVCFRVPGLGDPLADREVMTMDLLSRALPALGLDADAQRRAVTWLQDRVDRDA